MLSAAVGGSETLRVAVLLKFLWQLHEGDMWLVSMGVQSFQTKMSATAMKESLAVELQTVALSLSHFAPAVLSNQLTGSLHVRHYLWMIPSESLFNIWLFRRIT